MEKFYIADFFCQTLKLFEKLIKLLFDLFWSFKNF